MKKQQNVLLRHHYRVIFFILIHFLLFGTVSFGQVDTLRIATYNLLFFPDSTQSQRAPYFRIVVNAVNADILLVQDISSSEGCDYFLANILNYYEPGKYVAAPFVNGPDTDNELYYRPEKLTLISNEQISTNNRDISKYVLSYTGIDGAPQMYVYSVHFTMGSEEIENQKRTAEATIVRDELSRLSDNSCFFVCGSTNFYRASEWGFQMLTDKDIYEGGQCFDPSDRVGEWHNNTDFADVHTHSSRTTTFGGGIGDGLNDRCDMILVSGNLLDQHFYSYVLNSQTNFGNDGEHFDLAVNTDFNNSVPDSVADALYYASNHLPVYLDFTVNAGATPVELKNFQASVLGNDVLLSWTTVSEANNYGFAIERKAVNGRWEEIGFQTGKGTTNALNFYSFIDKSVKAGHYLYQLKQIDFDGQIKFSPAIEVVVGTAKNYLLAQNYPNPFNASTKIQFQVPEKTQVKLTLYDMLGKKIAVLTDNVFDAGTHEILVDASELNSGLYFYKLETINFNIMKKLMILK